MVIGLGDAAPQMQHTNINVYIANRPPMPPYDRLGNQVPIQDTEIASIAQHTGNHWRKIFNVYAKLVYELMQTMDAANHSYPQTQKLMAPLKSCSTWQAYRDAHLLQADSATALLFSKPVIAPSRSVHIIMGKEYAQQLGYSYPSPFLVAHQHDNFACYPDQNVILCPYFDYRQLSNAKITALVGIIRSLIEVN